MRIALRKSGNDLSSLISSGRAGKGVPATRSEVLAALLRKRAAAWRGGLGQLEARLRNQILWSLPMEAPEDRAANDTAAPDEDETRDA
ncbi:MAG: hypothetical protein ACXWUP_12685 [Allosphingosinicella sp.]